MKLLCCIALLLSAPVAQGQPFWWNYAEKASNRAWQRSVECRCEQSFAIDLTDNGVLVRVFRSANPDEYQSAAKITSDTVAVFHTHLHDWIPSPQDREAEAKWHLPVYIIHGSVIVEAKP